MAFITMPDSLIQVGKAITRTLFKTYVKDNLDDLDSRTTGLEASVNKIIVFDEIVINASALGGGGSITGLDTYRASSDFSLTDAKIWIYGKGALAGNLEMEIQKSTTPDFSTNVSVFTTKPKIVYASASDYDESSNTVFNATNQEISEGDYLRLNISELPANGTIGRFGVYLIGEPS